MKIKNSLTRKIIIYITGILVVGLAVNLLLRAGFGLGAWDAASFNFNDMITIIINNMFDSNITITYGTTSFIISLILLLLVIIHRGLKRKHLLVLGSIFFISLSIDFWNLLILNSFHPEALEIKIVLLLFGVLLLPLGLTLLIVSELAAAIHDEFTMVVADVLKIKKFSVAKSLVEVIGFTLGFIFSIVTYLIQIEGMNYTINGNLSIATIILTITIGPIIGLYMKMFKYKV